MLSLWHNGLELLLKGGWIMYPLVLLAIIAVTVMQERFLAIREAAINARAMDGLTPLLEQRQFEAALQFCEEREGPVSAILAAGLRHRSMPLKDVERAMEEVAARELPALHERLGILDTVITMAPLLGLLGTITGMISAFAVVAGPDAASRSSALTGGVGEALIATATGLGIAISTLPIYNYLTERVKAVTGDIETRATQLLNILAVHRHEQNPRVVLRSVWKKPLRVETPDTSCLN